MATIAAAVGLTAFGTLGDVTAKNAGFPHSTIAGRRPMEYAGVRGDAYNDVERATAGLRGQLRLMAIDGDGNWAGRR